MRNTIFTRLMAGLLWLGFWSHVATAQVTYQVDFAGEWSAATHPGAFATNNPHFTRLVGGTHSDAVSFWEPGGLATRGIERMAELGNTSTLLGEVGTAITAGTAGSTILGPDLFSLPNSTSLTITVDEAYPLVTLVTMIAPSSDWFVGVSGLSLRENDQWLGQVSVDLYAYDAGTEEGSGFSLNNPATSPHEAISLLGAPFTGLSRLGTLTFTVVPESESLVLLMIGLAVVLVANPDRRQTAVLRSV